MRIAFVVDRLLPHGAGNIAVLQLDAAAVAGHQVVLITSTDSQLPSGFAHEVIFVPSMGNDFVDDLKSTLPVVLSGLAEASAQAAADLFIVHNFGRFGGNAALAVFDEAAPSIVWCHDEYPHAGYHFEFMTYTGVLRRSWEPWDRHRIPIHQHIEIARSLRRSVFIAPSLWLTNRLATTFGPTTPVAHIPNGIDLSCFSASGGDNLKTEQLRVLLAGSVSDPRKNLLLSLTALDLVADKLVQSVTLAGNNGPAGPVSKVLGTFLRARNISENLIAKIECAGWISDSAQMAELYNNHNLVLHTSQAENYPTVCLEAEASGVALIATDAGGTGETVVNGTLVPVAVTPARLAEHITNVSRHAGAPPQTAPSTSTFNEMWERTYGLALKLLAAQNER